MIIKFHFYCYMIMIRCFKKTCKYDLQLDSGGIELVGRVGFTLDCFTGECGR